MIQLNHSRKLAGYFLRLGTVGFGGPVALAARMHQDLVQARGWISAEDYREGLAFAQLAPGPLAAQLAMYLGWVEGGIAGALLVALAFIGPSFVMVLALSAAYVRYGGLPWMQAAFYGIGAAVIAIIARSAVKLARATLKADPLLWALFAVSLVVTAWSETEVVSLFLASGLIPVLVARIARRGAGDVAAAVVPWVLALGLPAVSLPPLLLLLGYFTGAALFVFGSGLAIVPFLHGGVVLQYHWLSERQFVDAVAVSMITPGPVVITVAFIGYLVAGPAGAVVSAIGVFCPTFLAVVLVAPWFRRWAARPAVKAFVAGVTAAATGAIGGAVVVMARHTMVDRWSVLLALATFVVLETRRVPEPVVLAAAGLIGWWVVGR